MKQPKLKAQWAETNISFSETKKIQRPQKRLGKYFVSILLPNTKFICVSYNSVLRFSNSECFGSGPDLLLC